MSSRVCNRETRAKTHHGTRRGPRKSVLCVESDQNSLNNSLMIRPIYDTQMDTKKLPRGVYPGLGLTKNTNDYPLFYNSKNASPASKHPTNKDFTDSKPYLSQEQGSSRERTPKLASLGRIKVNNLTGNFNKERQLVA